MAEIKTFTKKPVSIQAVQWRGHNSDEVIGFMGREAWQAGKWTINPLQNTVHIFTLEGERRADQNDWIIRGVKGEFYPCKPDIFAATYTEGAAAPSLPSQNVSAEELARRDYELELEEVAQICSGNAGLRKWDDLTTFEQKSRIFKAQRFLRALSGDKVSKENERE